MVECSVEDESGGDIRAFAIACGGAVIVEAATEFMARTGLPAVAVTESGAQQDRAERDPAYDQQENEGQAGQSNADALHPLFPLDAVHALNLCVRGVICNEVPLYEAAIDGQRAIP